VLKYKFARPDIERYKRQGFPEAIYCSVKTTEQVLNIVGRIKKTGVPVICTRADENIYRSVKKKYPGAKYHKSARLITIGQYPKAGKVSKSYICVVTAGTADIPVAEESAVTCEILGDKVERIYDVGVAGIHRLFEHEEKLVNASCVIVCAGMEGALPSIVGGLVPCVVIGVPTSVGYGTNLGGFSALLTMLNSCAANVCVVNIDDGFGAGISAHLIGVR